VAGEFEYLLHWDLPISTVVEFNEVGAYATKSQVSFFHNHYTILLSLLYSRLLSI
jgi:hypothetical protein